MENVGITLSEEEYTCLITIINQQIIVIRNMAQNPMMAMGLPPIEVIENIRHKLEEARVGKD